MRRANLIALVSLWLGIAGAHLFYFAWPPELQARVMYIMTHILLMITAGLLVYIGPKSVMWAIGCLWGYFESWQCAVCRIATFDQGPTHDSMLCVSLIGVHPYQILASCALAFLAIYLPNGQVWPRA